MYDSLECVPQSVPLNFNNIYISNRNDGEGLVLLVDTIPEELTAPLAPEFVCGVALQDEHSAFTFSVPRGVLQDRFSYVGKLYETHEIQEKLHREFTPSLAKPLPDPEQFRKPLEISKCSGSYGLREVLIDTLAVIVGFSIFLALVNWVLP